MNKISELIKKIFKRNKKNQDLDLEDLDYQSDPNLTSEIQTDNLQLDEIEDFDGTGEIHLDEQKLSWRDRLEQITTRLIDPFRNLNKKDLNDVFKRKKTTDEGITRTRKISTGSHKINLEKLPNEILSNKYHQSIHRFFQITMSLLITVFLANLVSDLFKPSSKKQMRKSQFFVIDDSKILTTNQVNQIKTANLFRTDKIILKEGEKIVSDENKVCKESSQKSSLPIKLLNTIVLQDSVKSIASVSVRSNSELKNFREGDKISTLARVGKIDRLKLIVKNLKTGQCESIESKNIQLAKPEKSTLKVLSKVESKAFKKNLKKINGIENNGNNFKIKKSFLQDKLKDINSLLTQARGITINNPDGTLSFKIVDIVPGSVYAYLDLQNGDVITAIDGEPIQNLNQVMKYFGNAANLSKLNLKVKRGGEEAVKNYTIE